MLTYEYWIYRCVFGGVWKLKRFTPQICASLPRLSIKTQQLPRSHTCTQHIHVHTRVHVRNTYTRTCTQHIHAYMYAQLHSPTDTPTVYQHCSILLTRRQIIHLPHKEHPMKIVYNSIRTII